MLIIIKRICITSTLLILSEWKPEKTVTYVQILKYPQIEIQVLGVIYPTKKETHHLEPFNSQDDHK